jgi:hypothetical protein
MTVTFKPQLSGKTLRWLTGVTLLDANQSLTVAEIVARIEERFAIPGARSGKAVSDALRWELRRGRVVLVARGRYAAGLMPRSTEYGLRKRVENLAYELSLVATSAARRAAPVPAVATDRDEREAREAESIFTSDGAVNLDAIDGGAGADDDE